MTDSEPTKIRVHLVDADQASQQQVRNALSGADDMVLLDCTAGVDDTFARLQSHTPNVILVDLGLPDRAASRITRRLREEYPNLSIGVLTLHDDKQCLLEYLNWGARGFLLKPVEQDPLVAAIREIVQGGRFVDPLLPHCLVSHYIANPGAIQASDPSKVEILTVREREVCRYLASGYTNAEVADALRISKRTVETHRAAIMSKVGVKSRAQLVHFAIEHGLWPGPALAPRHTNVTPGE